MPHPDRGTTANTGQGRRPDFHAALDRAPDERERFLHQACGGDTALLVTEVESLLLSDSPSAQHTFEEWAGLVAAARAQDEAAEADRLSRPLIGQPLSHYDIIDRLGAGGTGEVDRAKDRALGRHVAIKILPLALAGDPRRLERFRLEARAASALTHPNVAAIPMSRGRPGACRSSPWNTSRGGRWMRFCGDGPMTFEAALSLTLPIVAALAAAHRAGLLTVTSSRAT